MMQVGSRQCPAKSQDARDEEGTIVRRKEVLFPGGCVENVVFHGSSLCSDLLIAVSREDSVVVNARRYGCAVPCYVSGHNASRLFGRARRGKGQTALLQSSCLSLEKQTSKEPGNLLSQEKKNPTLVFFFHDNLTENFVKSLQSLHRYVFVPPPPPNKKRKKQKSEGKGVFF